MNYKLQNVINQNKMLSLHNCVNHHIILYDYLLMSDKNMNEDDGTTSIFNLPGNENENIKMEVKETPDNMNEFVSGIQKAQEKGMLTLPSRDIPMDQTEIVQDEQVKPNYIPTNTDYIDDFETRKEIMNKQRTNYNHEVNTEIMFDQLHIYILLALLFFFFQLPIFNKLMFIYLPFCFFKDGNLNIFGIFTRTTLFISIFYGLFQGMNFLQNI